MKRKHLKRKRYVRNIHHMKMVPDEEYMREVRALNASLLSIKESGCLDSEEAVSVLREFVNSCGPRSFNSRDINDN